MNSCLLRVKVRKFCFLQRQLFEEGMKKDFILLENLLKGEHIRKKIVKNDALRDDKKPKRLHTLN